MDTAVPLQRVQCPLCKKEVDKVGQTLAEHDCFHPADQKLPDSTSRANLSTKDQKCSVFKCSKCKSDVVKVGQKIMGHKCRMLLRCNVTHSPSSHVSKVEDHKRKQEYKCLLIKCPDCNRDILQVGGKSSHTCKRLLLRQGNPSSTLTSCKNLDLKPVGKRFKCSLCQKDLEKSGGKILGHECRVDGRKVYVKREEHIPASGLLCDESIMKVNWNYENQKCSTFTDPLSVKVNEPVYIPTMDSMSQPEIILDAKSLPVDSCHHNPQTKGENASTNLHSETSINVDSWVKEHMDKGVVRFYKPKGSLLHSHPDLSENDLIIMILNDAQCGMLKQYGADCICVDVTKELKDDFELVTLMVLDENGHGLPCCFMLTNRVDSKIMEILFNVIKTVVGYSIGATVLMTDASPVFWTAWNVVMRCVPLNWLYSSWQVEAAWRKNFNLIRSVDKKITVQKALKTVCKATDEITFTQLLGSTLEEWGLDQDTVDFSSYFISEFSHNVTNWAYCYRKHLGEDKISHLERLHTVLEYIQHLGKQTKTLDTFIMALMKFIDDKFSSDGIISTDQSIETTSKISKIAHEHQEALVLKILQVNETIKGWSLLESSNNLSHKVTVCDLSCDCQLRCDLCRICLHSYKCSCVESSLTICSHIHYLVINGYTAHPLVQPIQPSSESVMFDSDLGVDFFVPAVLEARLESTIDNITSMETIEGAKAPQLIPLSQSPSRKRVFDPKESIDDLEKRKKMLSRNFQQILDCVETSESLDALESLIKSFVPAPVESLSSTQIVATNTQTPENMVIDMPSKTIQKNEDRRSSIS